jgi:hypothetical protein
MNESHVDSVILLAVPFHQDADFHFECHLWLHLFMNTTSAGDEWISRGLCDVAGGSLPPGCRLWLWKADHHAGYPGISAVNIEVYLLQNIFEVHSFPLTTVSETFSIGWPGSNVLPCGSGFAIIMKVEIYISSLFFSNVDLFYFNKRSIISLNM